VYCSCQRTWPTLWGFVATPRSQCRCWPLRIESLIAAPLAQPADGIGFGKPGPVRADSAGRFVRIRRDASCESLLWWVGAVLPCPRGAGHRHGTGARVAEDPQFPNEQPCHDFLPAPGYPPREPQRLPRGSISTVDGTSDLVRQRVDQGRCVDSERRVQLDARGCPVRPGKPRGNSSRRHRRSQGRPASLIVPRAELDSGQGW